MIVTGFLFHFHAEALMGAKRLNIGLLVSTIHNSFDETIIEGVMQGAKELDCNLIIVPGHYINADYNDKVRTKNKYQYNSLFSYINNNNIDALIVSLGTIANTLSDDEKKQFLSNFEGVPITLVASDLDGYSSVGFDNTSGLRDGINDLIKVGNRKHICMVSGPLTNMDARERLEVFKEVLRENNLTLTDKQIVYGNFSKYCEEQVEELLANNPDCDAIVFANDSMAIGGYNVLKKHNISIGEDVLVMGFDDTPSSTTMVPHLSSVRADGALLGKEAIIECVNNIHSSNQFDKKIKTNIVKRSSTGYNDNLIIKTLYNEEFASLSKTDTLAAAELITGAYLSESIYREESIYFEKYMTSFISDFFNQVSNGQKAEILPWIRKNLDLLFDSTLGKRMDFTKCMQLIDLIRSLAIKCYPDKESYINELVFLYLTYASKRVEANNQNKFKKVNIQNWLSNTISRDMLYYDDDESKGYATVIDKFLYLGYKGAMLYVLDSPYLLDKEQKISGWSKPETFKLKGFSFEADNVKVFEDNDPEIYSYLLFNNQYVPYNRRHTFVMDFIYSYDELLGMMVSEVEDYLLLKYYDSLIAQVCSSCKHLSTYKAYMDVQHQLEKTLDELKNANKELATISVTDELTGILNRRGFFENIKKLINKEENKNRNCAMLFCDMDNLKLINDQFGHDDGDFALRASAKMLRNAVGEDGVISRIGGDEFAVFTFIDNQSDTDICDKIHDECDRYNASSEKTYYIDISTGSVSFINEDGVDVNKKLDEADDILYQNKRYKRKNIIKK